MDQLALVSGVTRAIAEFEIYARHGILAGNIRIENLHRIYQRIQPVLHPMASNPKIVDFGALGYALSRLPHSICTVNRIRLKRTVPKDFEKWAGVKSIPTDIDGRPTFAIDEGEIVLVIQDETADVLEILSLLCCLTVECKKVRKRLLDSGLENILRDYAQDSRETSFGFSIKTTLPPAKKNQLFARLAFELGTTVETLLLLDHDWRGQLIQKMYEIANWDHDITVLFHSTISKGTYAARTREWAKDIELALAKLGFGDRPLHVVSTDQYSVEDLLLSAQRVTDLQRTLRLTRSELVKRLEKEMVDREGEEMLEPNHSYFLSRLLAAEERGKKKEEPQVPGIYPIQDNHQTGLRCRLIDVAQLDASKFDPRLAVDLERIEKERPLILHIGWVFGGQAGKILEALTSIFAHRILSYNLVFLAGSLRSDRGTILVPTYIIKDGTQDVIDFLHPNSFDPKGLEGLTKHGVDADGPVVTVLGIVLQSRQQLIQYQQMWNAIGVETIGAGCGTSLNHAVLDQRLAPDAKFRLAYVATDNPIREEETLAHSVRYLGINSTYAVTIALLNSILGKQ